MKHPCTCEHPSQDKINGKGIRVFNKIKTSAGSAPQYRCTVCTKQITAKESAVDKKAAEKK